MMAVLMSWAECTLRQFAMPLAAAFLSLFGTLASAGDLAAEANAIERSRALASDAVAAYRAGKLDESAGLFEIALILRPNHPGMTYNLASLHARQKRPQKALRFLAAYAAMGLTADLSRSDDFDDLESRPEFVKISRQLSDNGKPKIASEVAFTIADRALLMEGIAFDANSGRFFISSVHKRKILVLAPEGGAGNFIAAGQDGVWGVFGSAVDARRQVLWATSGTVPEMAGHPGDGNGGTGVFKFALEDGRLLDKMLITDAPESHQLSDLVVAADGKLYVSDSRYPVIHQVMAGGRELRVFVESESFASLQGLALSADGNKLFAADYAAGIHVIDVATRTVGLLAAPQGQTLFGINGLASHGADLIAIQNGVQPARVIRLRLDAEGSKVTKLTVLESAHPDHDDPTLGVVVDGALYYVANSQWPGFGAGGPRLSQAELKTPIILRLPLIPVGADDRDDE